MLFSLIFSLMIIMGIQFLVTFVLQLFGVDYYIIMIAVDFAVAFFFTFRNFKQLGRPATKDIFKNPLFHRNLVITFVVLLTFSYLFNFVF